MVFENAVTYLISVLQTGVLHHDDGLLNNVVYYIPRLQTIKTLQTLVKSTFESSVWANTELFDLYEATQATFQWKLEISEPTISLEDFYRIWDFTFAQSPSWTLQKLAMLGGALSTNFSFMTLQRTKFLDDSGEVSKLYGRWRNEYFISLWCSLISKPQPITHLDEIVAIYATINESSDIKNKGIPWNTVTLALARLSTNYIKYPPLRNSPITRHLNKFVKTLQVSVQKSDNSVITKVLNALCRECFNLCAREVNSLQPNRSYSDEYYRNVLFVVVIELKAILTSTQQIPEEWYPQIIMCLFHTNFITHDIGVIGFESYEDIYGVIITGITMCSDFLVYVHVLDTMQGNIWKNLTYPNKPNDAKLLFMLNFMEKTLPNVANMSPKFIETVVNPLQNAYIDSPDSEIRESMHLVLLSLFQNFLSGDDLASWQAKHYLDYIAIATTHFLLGQLSENQLIIIFQRMSSSLPLLQTIDRDLSKSTLHYTYLRIINCTKQDNQRVLLLCLIYQLPYVNKEFLIDWLNTCQELIYAIGFDRKQKTTILEVLWEVISSSKSEVALKWWYGNVVSSKNFL